MSLPIEAVQQALREEKLDGWLLYDFQGFNPIASRLVGLAGSGKMTTRRWYYFVPAAGAPRGLVHAIESHNLDDLPGDKRIYAGREQLGTGLKDLLNGARTIAMEYSPGNAIPYVSRVDAGTIETVRAVRRHRRLVWRPGTAVRSPLVRRGIRHPRCRFGSSLSHQGPRVRDDQGAHGGARRADGD